MWTKCWNLILRATLFWVICGWHCISLQFIVSFVLFISNVRRGSSDVALHTKDTWQPCSQHTEPAQVSAVVHQDCPQTEAWTSQEKRDGKARSSQEILLRMSDAGAESRPTLRQESSSQPWPPPTVATQLLSRLKNSLVPTPWAWWVSYTNLTWHNTSKEVLMRFCRLHAVQEATAFRAEVLREYARQHSFNPTVLNQREHFHHRSLLRAARSTVDCFQRSRQTTLSQRYTSEDRYYM